MSQKRHLTRRLFTRLILISILLVEFAILFFVFLLFVPLQYRKVSIQMPDNQSAQLKESIITLPDLLFPLKEHKKHICTDTKVHLLVKDNWYFIEELYKSTRTCYATVEPPDEKNGFKTGFTVRVMKDLKSKIETAPDDYARLYIRRKRKCFVSFIWC